MEEYSSESSKKPRRRGVSAPTEGWSTTRLVKPPQFAEKFWPIDRVPGFWYQVR